MWNSSWSVVKSPSQLLLEKDRLIEIEMSPSESLVLIFQTLKEDSQSCKDGSNNFSVTATISSILLGSSQKYYCRTVCHEPDFWEVTPRQIFASRKFIEQCSQDLHLSGMKDAELGRGNLTVMRLHQGPADPMGALQLRWSFRVISRPLYFHIDQSLDVGHLWKGTR